MAPIIEIMDHIINAINGQKQLYTNMAIFEVRIVAAAGWADMYLSVATSGQDGAGPKLAFCFLCQLKMLGIIIYWGP